MLHLADSISILYNLHTSCITTGTNFLLDQLFCFGINYRTIYLCIRTIKIIQLAAYHENRCTDSGYYIFNLSHILY